MAIDAPYTHKFEYSLGDGGKFIKGYIEFNDDDKVSYKLVSLSEPLENSVLTDFTELTELLKKIFHEHGGIQTIKFVNKE